MDETTLVDSEEQLLIDLEAEEAAAAADPAAAIPAGDDTAPASADGAAQPEPEPAAEPEPAPQPASDEIRIPKPRLDAVLARNRELELENARLAGIAEGVKQGAAAKPAAEPEVKTDPAADRLIAIESEKDDLYAKVDAGEMTFVDLRAAERKLNAEAAQLRDVITDRKRQPTPEPQAPDINGDLRLNELTMQLAVENEWIGDIEQDYMLEVIIPTAKRIMAKRQIPFTNDAAGLYRLRVATIETAKGMGAYKLFSPPERWPAEDGARAAPAAAPAQSANGKARIPTAHLTPAQVRERMADKRDLAARQPPELVAAGTRLPGEMTSAKDVAEMTEDELSELSEAEQERLAPSRAR